MKRNEAFPSKYVSGDDVKERDIIVTIASVVREPVKSEDGEEIKTVIHFTDHDKSMICNGVNWDTIASITGNDDSDGWSGTKIALFWDPTVRFGNKQTGGVRVKAASSGAAFSGGNYLKAFAESLLAIEPDADTRKERLAIALQNVTGDAAFDWKKLDAKQAVEVHDEFKRLTALSELPEGLEL